MRMDLFVPGPFRRIVAVTDPPGSAPIGVAVTSAGFVNCVLKFQYANAPVPAGNCPVLGINRIFELSVGLLTVLDPFCVRTVLRLPVCEAVANGGGITEAGAK